MAGLRPLPVDGSLRLRGWKVCKPQAGGWRLGLKGFERRYPEEPSDGFWVGVVAGRKADVCQTVFDGFRSRLVLEDCMGVSGVARPRSGRGA